MMSVDKQYSDFRIIVIVDMIVAIDENSRVVSAFFYFEVEKIIFCYYW